MATTKERIDIDKNLYIYRTNLIWSCRFKVNKRWYAFTTNETDGAMATVRAIEIRTTTVIKIENDIEISSGRRYRNKLFKNILKSYEETVDLSQRKYQNYLATLKKYHIPYFAEIMVTDIDKTMLDEYEIWRETEFRIFNRSTIQNHNAALLSVLNHACDVGIMVPRSLPTIPNSGLQGGKRAAFNHQEYTAILAFTEQWINEKRRKKLTKNTRRLLKNYIIIGWNTGMRAGTEMAGLRYSDIEKIAGNQFINVKFGKTIKHTGIRRVILNKECLKAVEELKSFNMSDDNDYLFRFKNGEVPKRISQQFTLLLEKMGLTENEYGVRTLYSLRHSFITNAIVKGLNLTLIAEHCGTSIDMIATHYSHIKPEYHSAELAGVGHGGAVLILK